jgi:mono/diheme cytochrome c family protein/uncharacterized membrane protein
LRVAIVFLSSGLIGPTAVRAYGPPNGTRELYEQHCVKCHGKDGKGTAARNLYPDIPDLTNADWHGRRTDEQLSASILDGKGNDMPPMRSKINAEQARGLVAHVRSLAPTKDRKEPEKKKAFASTSDFEKEMRRLQEEWDELQKKSRELARASAKKECPRPADPPPPAPAKSASEPKPPPAPAKLASEPEPQEPRAASQSRLSPTAAVDTPDSIDPYARHCSKCHGKDGAGRDARSRLPNIPDFTDASWQARRSDAQLLASILDGKGKMPPARAKVSEAQARALVGHVREFAATTERSAKEEQEQPTPETPAEREAPEASFAQLTRWLGKFHPATVHFPIALLTAAAVAEFLRMTTGRPVFAPASRFCVWLAAITAIVAGSLGWATGGFRLTDTSSLMAAHRLLGTCTVIVAAILPMLSEASHHSAHSLVWFRIALFGSAGFVLLTGFLGGALVYGLDHYAWP